MANGSSNRRCKQLKMDDYVVRYTVPKLTRFGQIWTVFQNLEFSILNTFGNLVFRVLAILNIFGNTLKYCLVGRRIKINLIIQERVYCRQV